MDEAVFQQEMKESIRLQYHNSFYYKPSDVYVPYQKNGFTGKVARGFRFQTVKPFDVFFIVHGHPYAFELKMVKDSEPFQLSRVKKHQIEALDRFRASGGSAFVVVNYRFDEPAWGKINRSFAVDIKKFLDILVLLGTKTLSFRIIADNWTELLWSSGVWNLNPIVTANVITIPDVEHPTP